MTRNTEGIPAQAEALAALIRKVDGRHDLSAAALAERLVEEGVTIGQAEELTRLRAAITKVANLQANSPEAYVEIYDHITTAIGGVLDEYGCDDCRGKTFEDGSVCCWTCGRVLPDAPEVAK